jgi:hypothetical protein
MVKHILHVSNFYHHLLEAMVKDVPDEKFCLQPPGLPNHPAWIVGHLSVIRSMANKTLGNPVDFPETWTTLFGRGSTPTDDRAAYPSKDELLGTFRRLHASACEALEKTPAEKFAGPHPIERLREFFPTLGDLMVQAFVGHDGLHVGQLSDWRRANGYSRLA